MSQKNKCKYLLYLLRRPNVHCTDENSLMKFISDVYICEKISPCFFA